MGVIGQEVYQSIDNPNDVTVTHDFRKAETAKAFAASPDLKGAMEKAGVKGTPQIWLTTKGKRESQQLGCGTPGAQQPRSSDLNCCVFGPGRRPVFHLAACEPVRDHTRRGSIDRRHQPH